MLIICTVYKAHTHNNMLKWQKLTPLWMCPTDPIIKLTPRVRTAWEGQAGKTTKPANWIGNLRTTDVPPYDKRRKLIILYVHVLNIIYIDFTEYNLFFTIIILRKWKKTFEIWNKRIDQIMIIIEIIRDQVPPKQK